MKWHKVILNIAARLIHLNSPMYGKVTLHPPTISRIKVSLHHMVERKIEEIPIVQEFPDMFPDDLLGMPSERAIEFKIELQLDIAPIAKSLYQMTLVELAELKVQQKNLLDKSYICPSSSPWCCLTLFVKKKDEALHLCMNY
jgi:hypothetical protein